MENFIENFLDSHLESIFGAVNGQINIIAGIILSIIGVAVFITTIKKQPSKAKRIVSLVCCIVGGLAVLTGFAQIIF